MGIIILQLKLGKTEMSFLFCYLAEFVREFKHLLEIYWNLLIKCFLVVNNQNVGLINQAPTK